MAVFAIGDLHLSTVHPKPMDKFGWHNHEQKIFNNWKEQVKDGDLVLIAGDISWEMKFKDAVLDLQKIDKMPGDKILIRGNHDYWWDSVSKMSRAFSNLSFLHNNSFVWNDYCVYGTRGWNCPGSCMFKPEDSKIYNHEVLRLENSFKSRDYKNLSCKKIIVMMHYPPMNEKHEDSGFTNIIDAYNTDMVVYGHLHGKDSFLSGFTGQKNNTFYNLVSCDYLNFKLLKIFD